MGSNSKLAGSYLNTDWCNGQPLPDLLLVLTDSTGTFGLLFTFVHQPDLLIDDLRNGVHPAAPLGLPLILLVQVLRFTE